MTVRTLVLAIALSLPAVPASADSWTFAGTNPNLVTSPVADGVVMIKLADGRLLLMSSNRSMTQSRALVFDPDTLSSHQVSGPSMPQVFLATLLHDGRVLAIVGPTPDAPTNLIELYDPLTDSWAAAAPMATARFRPSATVLNDGRVLVIGGDGSSGAELYDPVANSWQAAAAIAERFGHSATLLPNGGVLIVGGFDEDEHDLNSVTIYDPAADTWIPGTPSVDFHGYHNAVTLPDGTILVVGGNAQGSAERYHPLTDTWTDAGALAAAKARPAVAASGDGKVIVVSGMQTAMTPPYVELTVTADLYDPDSNTWSAAAPAAQTRYAGQALLLDDGRIAVGAGFAELPSIELYDPASDSWLSPEALPIPLALHSAALLTNGQVLVTGGLSTEFTPRRDAILYDPLANHWVSAADMNQPRIYHSATTLADGQVLVAGGLPGSLPGSSELYDPISDQWTPTGPMNALRAEHTATPLADGRVLVAGGRNNTDLDSAEVYDPNTEMWSPTGSLHVARTDHTATLLPNGRVLVVGGGTGSSATARTEIYDPESGVWTEVSPLNAARRKHSAMLLADGRVLVAGGESGASLNSVEIYDASADTWTTVAPLALARQGHHGVLLAGGDVLIAGGDGETAGLIECERYHPLTDTWSTDAPMLMGGRYATLTSLQDGSALAVGGAFNDFASSSAERYRPESAADGCPTIPEESCLSAGKSTLAIKRSADSAKNGLSWKWNKGATALSQADFGDPVDAGTSYSVCLYAGSDLHFETAIDAGGLCAGKPCWKKVSDRGWSYKNKPANDDGVVKAAFKGGDAGKPKLQVGGKGAKLALPAPASGSVFFNSGEVVIQLHRNDGDSCWSSRFSVAAAKKNDGVQFKAAASE